METEDGEYEVTAEMLIHEDMDDERTLEEEEALQDQVEVMEELSNLEKEGEMPIEDLMKRYGYSLDGSPSPTGDADQWSSGISSSSSDQTYQPPNPKLFSPRNPKLFSPCTDQPSSEHGSPVKNVVSADQLQTTELVVPCPMDLTSVHGAESAPDLLVTQSDSSLVSKTKRVVGRKPVTHSRRGADPEALARLRPVPERRSMRPLGTSGSAAALESTFEAWLGADDLSDDETSSDDSWRQEIRVGSEHQAEVPTCPSHSPYPPQSNHLDELLWSPYASSEQSVRQYLVQVSNVLLAQDGLPNGSHDRDNEQALHILQCCGHKADKALEEFRQQAGSCGISPWTEEECRKFEAGLRTLGKDFSALKNQVVSRSVKELVEFYYLWKKTERYDAFAQHGTMGKKKLFLQPGAMSDYMEKCLDPGDGDLNDIHYASTTLTAEVKKESTHHLLGDQLKQMHQKTVSASSS